MVKIQCTVVTVLFLLCLIFAMTDTCFGDAQNYRPTGRLSLFVVGGEVAYPDQFPYTVSIQQLRPPRFPLWYHFCGGTIIAPKYVLSAAHCFANRHLEYGFLSTYRVVGGATDISKESNRQQIGYLEKVHLAKNDIPSSNSYLLAPRDIALIRLSSSWQWNEHVLPMDLPWSKKDPLDYEESTELPDSDQSTEYPGTTFHIEPPKSKRKTAIMSGFGAIKDIKNVGSVKSSLLRFMDVPIITFEDCIGRLKNQTSNFNNSLDSHDNFCTGTFSGTQEACIGDSGGPLVMITGDGPVLVGVVSFGMRPCGFYKHAPTVYTKVSRYVPWIKKKMWYDEASWRDYILAVAKATLNSLKIWIASLF